MTALDFVWAHYIAAVHDKRPIMSAVLSAAMVGLNSLVVLSYSDNHWMVPPTVAGAFVGTYLSVWRQSK
jgi:hypothetical protein